MSRANCADNTFTHPRNDRFFGRATDESIEVGTHGNTRLHFDADAVLSNAVNCSAAHVWGRGVDHFRIDARAHRFEHGLAGSFSRQIDGAGPIEIERNPGFIRRDQCQNHVTDVAACQIMRFERIAPNIQTGFHRRDTIVDNQSDRHFAQAHADHFSNADGRVCDPSSEPRHEIFGDNDYNHKREDREDCEADKIKRFHSARKLSEGIQPAKL